IEMRSGVNSEVRHWVSEPGLIDELGSIWTKAKWKWFLVEKKVTDAFDLIEVSPKGQVDEDLGFFCRMVTDPRVPQWRDDTTEISEHFLSLCTAVRREHLLSEHRGDPRSSDYRASKYLVASFSWCGVVDDGLDECHDSHEMFAWTPTGTGEVGSIVTTSHPVT